MYILIFEDGQVKKAAEVMSEDISSLESGYLMDIIDIKDSDNPKRFNVESMTWAELEVAE